MRISDWSSAVCSSDLDRKDAAQIFEDILDREILANGAALRARDAEAAGRDRLRASARNRLRAPRIADIDEDQRVAGDVQRAKFSHFIQHQKRSLFSNSSLIGRP